jgi:hypothetical protein
LTSLKTSKSDGSDSKGSGAKKGGSTKATKAGD